MKILVLGDIVNRYGRKLINDELSLLKKENNIDFIIGNGENAATGNGITRKCANELFEAGIDVLTSGNHIWDKKEIYDFIQQEKRLLRPANYPSPSCGNGFGIYRCNNTRIGVINLSGTVFMNPLDNPFLTFDKIYQNIHSSCDIIIVDFHAEATSEKIALGYYVDGRANAFYGTHTHVQTADNRVLENGCGYITDIGMCGSVDGVLGVDKEGIIKKFKTQRPCKFEIAKGSMQINGAIFTFGENNKCIDVKRIYNIYP